MQTTPSRGEALQALFARHYADLVRLARLLVDERESAEDIVMDAFAGLNRRWLTLRDTDRAYHYLRQAVINGSKSQFRRARVARRRENNAPAIQVSSAEDHVLAAESAHSVAARLRLLPTRQRQVLVLRYYLDLSEAQIADELGIGRGSVKTHAARGLAALAAHLEAPR